MHRILLVDDDSGMYTDLTLLYEESDFNDIEIDEIESGNEALRLSNGDSYDLLILNLALPETDMLGLIGKLKLQNPDLPILAYSQILEYTFVKRYITSGLTGYCFVKNDNKDEMLTAIQTIISGKWYISPEMAEYIVEEALFNKNTDRLDTLDDREFEILTHFVKGESPESIASTLGVHVMTVSLYKSRIMDKLRITNFMDLKILSIP